MRSWVGRGVLVGVLLVAACGDDDGDSGRDSLNEDAGPVDGGALDGGGLDASAEMDASASDASTNPDATYYVNDAGETVQECAKSKECPTGYRCEQDGARKACVEVEGVGERCSSGYPCESHLYCDIATQACMVIGCQPNPSLCPSGSVCCSVGGGTASGCYSQCPSGAEVVPEP